MGLSELQKLTKELKTKFRDAHQAARDEVKANPDESANYMNIMRDKDHEVVSNFLDALLSQKERFTHVYETEKGSTYFVLKSGESLRLKRSRDDEEKWGRYSVKPMMEKTVFIPSETVELLKTKLHEGYSSTSSWIGIDFKMGEYEVGMHPFEINMVHQQGRRMFMETNNDTFRFVGSEEEGITYTDELNAAYHPGNKIIKIIN